jgi:hypothetical protein
MAYTQEDLDNIKAAISSGERRVRLADKEVEYRTIDEMLKVKSLIENELRGTKIGITRVYADYSRGVG